MKKLKLLLALFALLVGGNSAWAQGTWTAPAVPGVNPLELGTSDEFYLLNIKADAFVNYGFNWNTQAITSRLFSGDEAPSGRHLLKLVVDGSNIKLSLKDKSDKNIFCGGGTTTDVWTDNTYNAVWTPTASANYVNAYTLVNTAHAGKNLDVQWKYGGRLTFDGGQGYTDWAFIPAASIADGSYARYKALRDMYAIYKELEANNKVNTYSEALATANAVYTNASASKAEIRAAARALLNAVADGIENPVNASFLFDNADILGDFNSSAWGPSLEGNDLKEGSAEKWHSSITFSQTKTDAPNGLYSVVFHGLYRQDNDAETAPRLTVTGTNVLGDDLKTLASLKDLWALGGSNGDWANGVPNNRTSAGQGMTLGEAVAAINNVQVKGNSLGIELAITGKNQWVLFQGFDIIYNGPINVALYKQIVAKKATAQELASSPMEAGVKNELNNAILEASGVTANSDESDLNDVISHLDTAIENAETSISDYAAISNYITFTNAKVAGDYSSISTALSNGDYATQAEGILAVKAIRNSIAYAAAADKENITQLIDNPGYEMGNTNYWTVGASADTGAKSTSDATYSMENSEGSYLFNTWWKGIPLTQNLGTLPAGTYTLITTVASDGATIYLTVNDDHSTFIETTDKTKGLTLNKTFTLDAATEVTVGVVGGAEDGTYTAEGYWWYKADNFRLIKGEIILPTALGLDKSSLELTTGFKETLTATFTPANTTDQSVSWSSSDNNVVTVSDGVVIAKGVGTATITAKSSILGSVYATATITVADAGIIANCSEVDEGDFFIRNVATGQFLGAGNNYGTRASIMKHGIPFGLTKVSDGVYTFDSYMFRDANNHFLRGDYCDQGATNIYVTDLGEGKYALSTEASNKFISVNAGTTIVENAAANSSSSLAQWQFFSKGKLLENLISSTESNPGDATFYIDQAENTMHQVLSNGNSAWKGEYALGGTSENRCAERFQNITNVYQTVAVPNGTYIVKAQGFYRNQSGDTPSYLYANEQQVALNKVIGTTVVNSMSDASNAFLRGEYENELEVTVTDNKLTVGIKCDVATNWTLWDNFELYLKNTTGLNVVPVIADGDYYLATDGKLINRRGSGEANQALMSDEGLEVAVKTDIAGISTIVSKDTGLRLFWNEEKTYTDGTLHVQKNYHHPFWAIEENGEYFKIRNIETGLYLASEDNVVTCAEEGSDWLFTENVIIDEKDDYTPVAMAANVTLNRTIKADTWNTFVVPFDIDNSTLMAKFGNDVEVAEWSEDPNDAEYGSSTIIFDRMDTPAIEANTPVLLKTSEAGTTYVFNGVKVEAENPIISGENYDFVGSYEASIKLEDGDYFIANDKLWPAENNVTTVKGTRAYLKANSAEARIVDFRIGDSETTGIVSIDNGVKSADNATFDLQGRKVANVKKGLYIKNSKKVVVR